MSNTKLISVDLIYSEEFVKETKVQDAEGKDQIVPEHYVQVLYTPAGERVASVDPMTGKVFCNVQALVDYHESLQNNDAQ